MRAAFHAETGPICKIEVLVCDFGRLFPPLLLAFMQYKLCKVKKILIGTKEIGRAHV